MLSEHLHMLCLMSMQDSISTPVEDPVDFHAQALVSCKLCLLKPCNLLLLPMPSMLFRDRRRLHRLRKYGQAVILADSP